MSASSRCGGRRTAPYMSRWPRGSYMSRRAHVVGMLADPGSALVDGPSRHGREAAADEAQRLAGAVQVERLDDQARAASRSRARSLVPGDRLAAARPRRLVRHRTLRIPRPPGITGLLAVLAPVRFAALVHDGQDLLAAFGPPPSRDGFPAAAGGLLALAHEGTLGRGAIGRGIGPDDAAAGPLRARPGHAPPVLPCRAPPRRCQP